MKQVQEEQGLATQANDAAPGLFTRSEDVPDPRCDFSHILALAHSWCIRLALPRKWRCALAILGEHDWGLHW